MNGDSPDGYDPFAFVPERISPITASGLAWLDEQLHEQNKARLRALPIERQATILAALLEAGTIGVRSDTVRDLLDAGAIRASEDNSDRQEASR
jgi:hypothetical protein